MPRPDYLALASRLSRKSRGTRLAGPVYYVTTGGSDSSGDGSPGAPWRTVGKALTSVSSGTVVVGPGTFSETGLTLPAGVSLVGAGMSSTTISATAGTVLTVNSTAWGQTVSDLTLEGNGTATFGLRVNSATGLRLLRFGAQNFNPTDNGGSVMLANATDTEVSYCDIRNGSKAMGGWCSGTLGLGGTVNRLSFHHNTVSAATGYACKASTATIQNSTFTDNTFYIAAQTCETWQTLCVEWWSCTMLNVEFAYNDLNGPLSLTGPSQNTALSSGWRVNVHHNDWQITSPTGYAVETSAWSCEIHHNYVNGGIHPLGQFEGNRPQKVSVHHNIFDNQGQPTPAVRWLAGCESTCDFTANTVLVRLLPDHAILTMDEGNMSTLPVRYNLFKADTNIGDKLEWGIPDSAISNNCFVNVTPRGSAYVTTEQSGYGAYKDGTFDVGVRS